MQKKQKKSSGFCSMFCGGCSGQQTLEAEQMNSMTIDSVDANKLKFIEIQQFEEKFIMRRAQYLKNINPQNDQQKLLTNQQYSKLNVWEQYEKQYPFYSMDVSLFMTMLLKARLFMIDKYDEQAPWDIQAVTLIALQKAFAQNKTWAQALKDDSKLTIFLNDKCQSVNDDNKTEHTYDINIIRSYALLWCKGSEKQKVEEFYDMIQERHQNIISAYNTKFLECITLMFDTSLENIQKETQNQQEMQQNSQANEIIQEIKDEKYELVIESILDNVFGTQSYITREVWHQKFTNSEKWLVNPKSIRAKLDFNE